MRIPEEMIGPLAPLASMAGGFVMLETLPFQSLIMAVTHTDDVVPVSFLEPDFTLSLMDLSQGYEVFDKHYKLVYAETPLTVEEEAWGTTKNDRQWIARAAVGDWAYVRYNMLGGEERVILIIRL